MKLHHCAKECWQSLNFERREQVENVQACFHVEVHVSSTSRSWEANAAIGRNVLPHHHNDEIGTLVLGLRTTSNHRWCHRKSFQQFSYSAFLSSTELDQSYKLTSSSYRAFRDTHPFSKEVSISYLLSKIFLALFLWVRYLYRDDGLEKSFSSGRCHSNGDECLRSNTSWRRTSVLTR